MPLLQSLLLSCALPFELTHGTGYRERVLIVLSSEFDAENIHAMTTTHRHKRHANWDPTSLPTHFELTGDAVFKVCTDLRASPQRAAFPPP